MSALDKALLSLPKTKTSATGKVPASKTFRVEPQHFADTWENKPADGFLIGIRVPSEADVQGARAEAIKAARGASVEEDEDRIQVFNDALMCCAVASAICDPSDVSAAHPFFDMPDDMVPLAFKPKTIKYIFDLTEILHIEQSPVFVEITPEEEFKLVSLLSEDDPYQGLDRVRAMKVRRLLHYALELLEE
jgi:hypothetical protein